MKTFLTILGLLAAAILQTSLLPFLALGEVVPNLVLVLIGLLVIFKDFRKVWGLVVLGSLFLDLFSGLPFGLISLSLVVTAYCLSQFKRSLFSEIKFWIVLFLIGLASLFYNLVLTGLGELFILVDLSRAEIYPTVISLNYLANLFLAAFYNIILLTFLYGLKKIFYQEQSSGKYRSRRNFFRR